MNNRLKNKFTWIFLFASVLLIGMFLYFSNRLVQSLEDEERAKMEIWASAYGRLFLADSDSDMTLELQIIEGNKTIPVFFTDENGLLLGANNMSIPADTAKYISDKIATLTSIGNYFEVKIDETQKQYLYYDESVLLHELHYYPYIQLIVIIVFVFLFYYMIVSRKQYEQNKIWVGLSKETAHQLGTPIQSLMGWTEYLDSVGCEVETGELQDIVKEIGKDINRLHTVADRFSKIGSEPKLEPANVGDIIGNVVDYMQKRVSQNITISYNTPKEEIIRPLCVPLFAWVIENLCKNAVDAMTEGKGMIRITVDTLRDKNGKAIIEVEDNGKGIAKNKLNSIFDAGYTTKTRGWGLGLTLVKRIVEQYHHGKIFVKSSTVGKGTVFRIEI